MPPAVVHVMGWHSQQYGSFERFMVERARQGEQAGMRTHLVFQSPPASSQFVADVPGDIHVVPAARAPADPRFVRDIHRVLRRTGATHLHGHFGLDAMNAVAIARASGVRRRFATKHILPGASRRSAARLRHRWLAAQVEVLFAVSAQVREQYVALGVPPEKVEVAYLGIDTEVYRPSAPTREAVRAELGLPDGRSLVLSVSHLRPGKGVELLPPLAAALGERGTDVLVAAAGEGPLRAQVQGDADARGLGPDRFRLLGVREDVPRLLAAADAYVFATTGNEGLPLAPLEAVAARVPVIASGVSDLPRLLGDVAYIVTPGALPELVDACAAALTDPDAAARAEAGRRHVQATLSAATGARAHLAHYLR